MLTKKRSLVLLSGILGLFIFIYVSTVPVVGIAPLLVETPTIFYENGGPFPDWPLTCPENMKIGNGPTWRGVTIGKSSIADIEELYGVHFAKIPPLYEGKFAPVFYVSLLATEAERRKISAVAEACVVGGKIAALELSLTYDEYFPSSLLHDWVWKYGIPEITTWVGEDWQWRTIIWPKAGLALVVDAGATVLDPTTVTVNSVTFFPYITDDDYRSRWPFSGLRKEPPTINNNDGFPTAENPIDYEAIMAAKPTSTPAP